MFKKITLIFTIASFLFFISYTRIVKADENNQPVKDKMNILLLGLDGRIGDSNPRCDAIHMISFDAIQNKITITSVPRGTEVPPENKNGEIYYIANYCHYFGLSAAISQIEKITGIHPDYVVRVGFSQVLGVFRSLDLPTTSTLQYLRNRESGYGDFQRSHNQAVFLKDMLVNYGEKIAAVPNVIKYLIYKTIDTDIPFEEATVLFNQLEKARFSQNPDLVTLVTKPANGLSLKDTHFVGESKTGTNDPEFTDYQGKLKNYFLNLFARLETLVKNNQYEYAYKLIKTPFSQQIWLQVDDENLRDQYHFTLLKYYVQTSPDNDKLSSYILDFITEMEVKRKDELKNKAEKLLENTT